MANTRSASKRSRQTAKRSLRNRSVISRLRGLHKQATGAGTTPEAKDVRSLISAVDKAAKRGIIHKNTANRRKARLNRLVSARAKAPAA